MATVGDITKEMTGMGEKTEEALEWSWSGITKARAMEHSPGITHKGGGRQGEDNTTTPSPNKLSKSDNGKLHTPHRKSKEKKNTLPMRWTFCQHGNLDRDMQCVWSMVHRFPCSVNQPQALSVTLSARCRTCERVTPCYQIAGKLSIHYA